MSSWILTLTFQLTANNLTAATCKRRTYHKTITHGKLQISIFISAFDTQIMKAYFFINLEKNLCIVISFVSSGDISDWNVPWLFIYISWEKKWHIFRDFPKWTEVVVTLSIFMYPWSMLWCQSLNLVSVGNSVHLIDRVIHNSIVAPL